jgi:hypothetical protein
MNMGYLSNYFSLSTIFYTPTLNLKATQKFTHDIKNKSKLMYKIIKTVHNACKIDIQI